MEKRTFKRDFDEYRPNSQDQALTPLPDATLFFRIDLDIVDDIFPRHRNLIAGQNLFFANSLLANSPQTLLTDLMEAVKTNKQKAPSVPPSLEPLSPIEKLRAAKQRVSEAKGAKDFLQQALSKKPTDVDAVTQITEFDEMDSLIDDLIQGAYEAGRNKIANYAEAGRAKLTANSEAQAEKLAPIIDEIKKGGAKSLRDIARVLNVREILTKNNNEWDASSVRLLLQKIDNIKQRKTDIVR